MVFFRHGGRTSDLCGHVRKLRDAQCDVLSPQALQALDAALRQTKKALRVQCGQGRAGQKRRRTGKGGQQVA